MISRPRIPNRTARKETLDSSSASTQGMFEPRSFVVQAQREKNSQQPDIKTSLVQAERYGHHISKIPPTGCSASTVIQQQPNLMASDKRAEQYGHSTDVLVEPVPMAAIKAPVQLTKPKTLRREDDFLTEHQFQKNGKTNKKSYISMEENDRGSIIPANLTGNASIYDHIQGGIDQKAKSPFTSFSPGEHKGAKPYGKYEVEVNLDTLKKDADKLGVKVHDNSQIQKHIQEDIHKRTKHKVEGVIPHKDIDSYVQGQKLSKNKQKPLTNRLQALANTHRDQEVLVEGKIPSQYVRRIGLRMDEYSKLKQELAQKVEGRNKRLKN
ncbi:hypothetical protein [Anabaena subtropica]|uniref:Uncharacterized protein n=1 Tax=Anabaena subtropica FACHB-260 TaxID=2692884 RepID=A0ABR8CPQ5_9NOST|nr:hypothetical protein [Anabaena subtropica]MBD2343785.1 hypothetical protein [Anabaena subtropica FACHB-260]